jgi:hypothetical protein
MPKRKNLPRVLLASDLGNLAIPLSILRRLVLVKRRYVTTVCGCPIDRLATKKRTSYLTSHWF